MTGRVFVTQMDLIRHPRTGMAYVAVDSMIDMLGGTAANMPEGSDVRRVLEQLATVLRPASSYAEPGHVLDPDPAAVEPYPCPRCRAQVFRGRTLNDHLVVVDLTHDPAGEWIPASSSDGVARLVPWSPSLDGLDDAVRVHEHACKAS